MKIIFLLLSIVLVGCKVDSSHKFKETHVDIIGKDGVYFKEGNEVHYITYDENPLMKNANLYVGLPVILSCKEDKCAFH